ncbi:carboxypeptidase regulatory-like domain-containing protein [Corallococcus exiguus]|uniref:carboxypeptidase regulatory-like domain-containing protein n=1 Tax=Corallococcus exiguus TaxID=83462 RepID=UPI001471713E|nr:carboxypeptidase regulatory-like domain-containing protein [Corallococcus exiguus]NNB91604.1 carboxypeptidase regulatory-like domain-containing protein [Corallococcus exiguus]
MVAESIGTEVPGSSMSAGDPHAVRGRVLGPQGPVANAVVLATLAQPPKPLEMIPCPSREDWEEYGLLSPLCRATLFTLESWRAERFDEERVLVRASTDSEGRFTLTGVGAGTFTVWVESPSGAGLREGVVAGMREAEVRLAEPRSLRGQVRDDSGQRAADVLVRAMHVTHRRYFETRTDATGRFELSSLPPGEYVVLFQREGLLSRLEELQGVAYPPLEVTMARSRMLPGRLLQGTKPVAGARVSLHGLFPPRETTTDEAGRFAFEGVHSGLHVFAANHQGQHALAEVAVREDEELPAVELVLGTGVRQRGRVTDARGKPIPGATVYARTGGRGEFGPAWTARRKATSADDGTYELGPLVPGRYQVQVLADGFLGEWGTWIRVDGTKRKSFVLRDAAVVRGTVVDTESQPVGRVRLDLWSRKGDMKPSDLRGLGPPGDLGLESGGFAQSRQDGTFALNATKVGPWFMRVQREGFQDVFLPVTSPSSDLRITLGEGASVSGGVTNSEGVPARGFRVTLEPAPGSTDSMPELATTTDAQGSFALRGPPPGKYRLQAEYWGGFEKRCVARDVEVIGTEVKLEALRLDEGLRVSGQVVDAAGRPLVGMQVGLEQAGAAKGREGRGSASCPSRRAASDAWVVEGGRFEVPHLDAGPHHLTVGQGYTLDAQASTGVSVDERGDAVVVQAGRSDVRLVLRRAPGIRGRLTREDGSPIPRYTLNGETVEDFEGAFYLSTRHASSTSLLVFKAAGLAPVSREVTAGKGEDVDLGAVVADRGGVVKGRVTNGVTGAAVAGALVQVEGIPDTAQGWTEWVDTSETEGGVRTAVDGTFTLPSVGALPKTLLVTHPRFVQARVLLSGQDIAVQLKPGATVQGTLRGVHTRLLRMVLSREGEPFTDGIQLEGEHFSRSDFPAGTYEVSVQSSSDRAPPFEVEPQTVTLPPGGKVTLDFVNRMRVTLRLHAPIDLEGIETALVPGKVPMPRSEAERQRILMDLQFLPDGDEHTWVYKSLKRGTYTFFIFEPRGSVVRTLRQEVTLPDRGEVDRTLDMKWANVPVGEADDGKE